MGPVGPELAGDERIPARDPLGDGEALVLLARGDDPGGDQAGEGSEGDGEEGDEDDEQESEECCGHGSILRPHTLQHKR